MLGKTLLPKGCASQQLCRSSLLAWGLKEKESSPPDKVSGEQWV